MPLKTKNVETSTLGKLINAHSFFTVEQLLTHKIEKAAVHMT